MIKAQKLTAVEFLHSEYKKHLANAPVDYTIAFNIVDAYAKAIQMEKEQMKEMYVRGINNYGY